MNKHDYECFKCKKIKKWTEFYHFKNGQIDTVCKKCIIHSPEYNMCNTSGRHNFCIRYDIPYLAEEWNNYCKRWIEKTKIPYLKQEDYFNIAGEYLARMKLCSYKNYTFDDSYEINTRREKQMKENTWILNGKRRPLPNAAEEYTTKQHDSAASAVDHPSHYADGRKYEPIEVIKDWGLDFDLGNTVKYISRAGRKDPAKTKEDLEKAKFYLEHAIRSLDK